MHVALTFSVPHHAAFSLSALPHSMSLQPTTLLCHSALTLDCPALPLVYSTTHCDILPPALYVLPMFSASSLLLTDKQTVTGVFYLPNFVSPEEALQLQECIARCAEPSQVVHLDH